MKTNRQQIRGKGKNIEQEDAAARSEGPPLRQLNFDGLKAVRPRTERQSEAIRSWAEGDDLALLGTAGTGKSFLGIFLGLSEVLAARNGLQRLVIIRSAVQGRQQGFLPGTLEEKQQVYEAPYEAIVNRLLGHATSYKRLKERNSIQFETTSFLRSVTFDNAVLLLDEVQNCTFDEIDTVMTRLGDNSRIILAGDTKRQIDLVTRVESSGVAQLQTVLDRMSGFTTVNFIRQDIVRSPRVREWITALEDTEQHTGETLCKSSTSKPPSPRPNASLNGHAPH